MNPKEIIQIIETMEAEERLRILIKLFETYFYREYPIVEDEDDY